MRQATPRRRRAGLTVALVVAGAGSLAAAAPQGPDDTPAVTTEQLAQSVKVYTLDGSVRRWVLDGSVDTVEAEEQQGADTVLLLDSDILFAFGSADLTPVASARIGELVAKAPQAASISVTGHTDGIGEDAANLDLSRRRAAAVAAAITAPRPDLAPAVDGKGESQPVATNDDPEGRESNRRVEVRYTR